MDYTMLKRRNNILTAVFCLLISIVNSQLAAYYSSTNFNTPNNQPYIDCNITFIGKSLASNKSNNGYQQAVQITQTIYKDTNLIKANKYALKGPVFNDTLKQPNFIDYQRYNLSNGNYKIVTEIKDLNLPKSK